MSSYRHLILCILISFTFVCVNSDYVDIISNSLYPQLSTVGKPRIEDLYLMAEKFKIMQALQRQEKVKIQLYYECLCPDCRDFDVSQFAPTVQKLSEYLDIHVYPYGNAKTIINKKGKLEIICQHGPTECYGNMLHACAIDQLGNLTRAILFNSCLMESNQNNKGSDDEAADKCGHSMNIDPEPIKSCAKGPRGFMLLKSYGEASKKAGFNGVPYILINGVENDGDHFMRDVCATFINPPKACNE